MRWARARTRFSRAPPHEPRSVHPALPRHDKPRRRLRPLRRIPRLRNPLPTRARTLGHRRARCRLDRARSDTESITGHRGAGLPAGRRSPSRRKLERSRRGQSRRDPAHGDIEAEGRHARPDEQELLAKFTAFGASDLADRLFRRAGEALRPRGKISASNSRGSSRATTSPTSSGRPNTPTTRRSS